MSELRSSLHPLSREELVAKIEQLRQDLAAAQEEAQYRGFLVRDLLPYQERSVKAETDLAAAKALLRDCLPELDGEGTTIHRVWAALAGKDEK